MGALVAEVEAQRGLGKALPVDPAEGMLAMVYESANLVGVYRSLVEGLDVGCTDDLGDYDSTGGDRGDGGYAGVVHGSLVGLTGNTRAPNEAARHIYVTLYDDERDRFMRYAKMCREAGVDERRVRLAEDQLDLMAGVLRRSLDGLLAVVVGLVGESDAGLAGAVEAVWRESEPGIVRGELDRARAQEGDE